MTMLEKESCLQQIKIQQLEGEDWPEIKVRPEAVMVSWVRVREVDESGFRVGIQPG